MVSSGSVATASPVSSPVPRGVRKVEPVASVGFLCAGGGPRSSKALLVAPAAAAGSPVASPGAEAVKPFPPAAVAAVAEVSVTEPPSAEAVVGVKAAG